MPRWLGWLIVILLVVVFVLPDPAGAGSAVGDAIDALIIFFRSVVNAART